MTPDEMITCAKIIAYRATHPRVRTTDAIKPRVTVQERVRTHDAKLTPEVGAHNPAMMGKQHSRDRITAGQRDGSPRRHRCVTESAAARCLASCT